MKKLSKKDLKTLIQLKYDIIYIDVTSEDFKDVYYNGVKVGYNFGLYGWNYDLYYYDNCYYIDGYRNMTYTKRASELIKGMK